MNIVVTDNSDEVLAALEANAEAALTAAGMFLEDEAKLELESDPRRVDTGNLRNSISNAVDTSDKSVAVGSNVEYAIYVHEGTRRMAANRFLRNAFQNNADQVRSYLRDKLSGN